VGTADGRIQLLLNTGTDANPQFGTPTYIQVGPAGSKTDLNVGARAAFDIVDWNDDGKADLVVGGLDGRVHVFLNDATSGAPDFPTDTVLQNGASDLLVPSGRASVAVADINGDGRKDLVVGNTDGQLLVYPNVGTDAAPAFAGSQPILASGTPLALAGTTRSRPFLVDFNHDGTLDVLMGAADGLVRWYDGQPQQAPTAGDFNTSDGVPGDTYIYTYSATLKEVSLQVTSDHPAGSVQGTPVTFTATVSASSTAAAAPTGTVQFMIDGSNFGSPVALLKGVAVSSAISALNTGPHTISAIYSGDSIYQSAQIAITQTVTPAPVTVQQLRTVTSRGDVSSIILVFSAALEPGPAQNIKNYTLVTAGRDGKLGTRDDVTVTIKKAVYNPATHTVTLTPSGKLASNVDCQLIVQATSQATGVTDTRGRLIDGNADGTPGGNYVGRFGPLPVVQSLKTTASRAGFTGIVLTFNLPMDPSRAQNLRDYTLISDGPDDRWGTADDQVIVLKKAVYKPSNRTVTLTPAAPLPRNEAHKLTVNGTSAASGLTDVNGDLLAGGNYVGLFGAAPRAAASARAFDVLALRNALPRIGTRSRLP